MPAVPSESSNADPAGTGQKPLPKGVVLGPDGKPCRSCTSVASWMQLAKQRDKPSSSGSGTSQSTTGAAAAFGAATMSQIPSVSEECPADVEQLGRSSWTLLHTLAGNYPERPTVTQQGDVRQFLSLFGRLYPCWVCASDFQEWMNSHEPRVSNRDDFGRWMCEAHNAVNEKLGKKTFDCNLWQERWRTGWKDGRCG